MPDSGIHVFPDDTASVASDLPSAQEYLTSLGVTETHYATTGPVRHDIEKVIVGGRVEAAELIDAQQDDGLDVQELIYSKVGTTYTTFYLYTHVPVF